MTGPRHVAPKDAACPRIFLIPRLSARPSTTRGSSPDRLQMLPSTHGVDLPCRPRSTPTSHRSVGHPDGSQEPVEGVVGPVAGCPRHGCRGQAPWKGSRRPRNRTHHGIPRNPAVASAVAVASAGAGRRPASNSQANSGAWRCSSRNSAALVSSPPPKPVSAPLLPITRWQGRMIGSGLRPFAAPTARVALGWPRCCAS